MEEHMQKIIKMMKDFPLLLKNNEILKNKLKFKRSISQYAKDRQLIKELKKKLKDLSYKWEEK